MISPASRIPRLARATLIGGWVTLGSTVAHTAADGTPAPLVALLPVVLVASGVAWLAAGRRLKPPTILGLLAVPQVGVHLLSGYVHGHQEMLSPAMLSAHVVSVGFTAWTIATIERVWWTYWRSVSRVLQPIRIVPTVVAPPPVLIATRHRPTQRLLRYVLIRRGPPSF